MAHKIPVNEAALDALHEAGAAYAAKVVPGGYIINVDDEVYPRIMALAPDTGTEMERFSAAIIQITSKQFGRA